MKRPLRHSEEYTDTDPKAMEGWIELQRRMSPGEKIAAALNLSHLALQLTSSPETRTFWHSAPSTGARMLTPQDYVNALADDLR